MNPTDYQKPIGQTPNGLDIYEIDPAHEPIIKKRGEVREMVIGGKDERILIENNWDYPYSSIGLLSANFKINGREYIGSGTATLVAPNVVLTCAHNVYLKDPKKGLYGEAYKVTFFPGKSGTRVYGEYQAKAPWLYPIEYQNSPSFDIQKNSDWAFVVLNQSVRNILPVPMIVDYPQTNKNIGIYGYPDIPPYHYLRGMVDRFILNPQDPDRIEYVLDTNEGQSGSPIIVYQDNGRLGIIGIHTTGTQQMNYGNRLTSNKYRSAAHWIKQSHGQELRANVVAANPF